MSEYKCIRAFTSVRTNRAYIYGKEIGRNEYMALPVAEHANFELLINEAPQREDNFTQTLYAPAQDWPTSIPDNSPTDEPNKSDDGFADFGGGDGGGAGASGGWESDNNSSDISSDSGGDIGSNDSYSND